MLITAYPPSSPNRGALANYDSTNESEGEFEIERRIRRQYNRIAVL